MVFNRAERVRRIEEEDYWIDKEGFSGPIVVSKRKIPPSQLQRFGILCTKSHGFVQIIGEDQLVSTVKKLDLRLMIQYGLSQSLHAALQSP